ncbi:MAG: histidine phosphatase family protein [Ruminococcaceae bacterium]|nr:histidine phosphatase family protein [Oscillospiraceae bacterium]
MKLIFVRHGKDDDRYRGGWSKLDLIPEGVEQAKQLAKHLKENNGEYKIGRIISSDLPRTMTTAKFISAELGIAIQEESRIRETNNGDLAGMLNDTALEQYPGLFFNSLRMDEAYPNGESPQDFYLRIKQWFWAFCSEYQNTDDNILIVTHGGVINVIYHLVAGIEWSNKSHAFKAANCSVHILDVDAMEFEVENRTDFLIV